MKIYILPKSTLGKWAVGITAFFILLSVLLSVLTALGGLEPSVGLPLGIAYGISGLGALATGLISVTKHKERSILVFLALFAGLFTLIFFLGEFLVPH